MAGRELGEDPLGHSRHRLIRVCDLESREHHQELVGAAVQQQITGGNTLPQAIGNLRQHHVSARVPDRVVDASEAVKVEVEQRHSRAVALRASERELRGARAVPVCVGRPVRKLLRINSAGPPSATCPLDLFGAEAAEVEDRAMRADRHPAPVAHDRVALPDPARLAVGADDPVLEVELLAAVEELLLCVTDAGHVVRVNARIPELLIGEEVRRRIPRPLRARRPRCSGSCPPVELRHVDERQRRLERLPPGIVVLGSRTGCGFRQPPWPHDGPIPAQLQAERTRGGNNPRRLSGGRSGRSDGAEASAASIAVTSARADCAVSSTATRALGPCDGSAKSMLSVCSAIACTG